MSDLEWEKDEETERKKSDIADMMKKLNEWRLPRRADKVELTEQQKYIIKHWVRPSATFSVRCDYCGRMYSSGFLKLCEKYTEGFCGRKPVEYKTPEPSGFTDDELGFYFGIDRSDLDKGD